MQGSSRSYVDIARANLFTFFNNILFAIGLALVALGQWRDALASAGLGLLNAVIGVVQEARAKRKLDQITLLTRPAVSVVRDGEERAIDQSALVVGDLVCVQAGGQVVADGRVVSEDRLELDESLLTGEADPVRKHEGDELLSGSFCVDGSGRYEAHSVGADSYAARVTRGAREFQLRKTPLQKKIELAVRLITVVVALMSLAILLQAALESLPLARVVQISAVLSGQIPYGLFFMAALAYTIGAASIAKRGALAQQVNAIESLSNVEVLCMDKTGTLTANRPRFHGLEALAGDAAGARLALARFVHSASVATKSSATIAEALPGERELPVDEIAFSSARKWSALAFEGGGTWALGALETLAPWLADEGASVAQRVAEQSRAGLRVLVLAGGTDATTLHDDAGEPRLPPLIAVAVVALEEELRPDAAETIAALSGLGISLKVISGDDPQTVAALARQAGLENGAAPVSGLELERMSPVELDMTARKATIFGRVSPEQKEQIVSSLARSGAYVAMIGDGVNDAQSLKRSKLGIAMESGSDVTRNVADIVLLGDSFEALRPALVEGRRIVSGLSNAMYLFLTRVATSTLLILAIAVVGLGFPYEPAQVSLTLFTVGIPSFFLTLWARPDPPRPDLLSSLARFALPAAIVTAILGVVVYTISYQAVLGGLQSSRALPTEVIAQYEDYTGLTFRQDSSFAVAAATIEAQTMLSLFVSITAFGLILFLEPPGRLFTAWTARSPDRRPALLAAVLLVVFLIVALTPALGNYFALVQVGGIQAIVLTIGVVLWFAALNAVWRARVFDRLFSVEGVE